MNHLWRSEVGALVLSVALTGAACGGAAKAALPAAGAGETAETLGVKALAPATRLEASVLRVSGSVRSAQEATLSARAGGTLTRVVAKVGDRVKQGQLLAQLDDAAMLRGLEQSAAAQALADASLDGARTDTERSRALAASGSLSRASLERAEISLRQAQAQAAQAAAAHANAERLVRETRVLAPFDGVITQKLKSLGDSVTMTPVTPIFTLVDTEGLEVRALVPEALIDSVKVGDTVTGTLNPSGAHFSAKVKNLGAVIDPRSRTIEVLADVLPAKDGPLVRPGALVELDLSAGASTQNGQASADGLFLPTQAVSELGDERFVWLVEAGKAKRRDVKVQTILPGFVRVLSGLQGQELVVADASLALKDGTALKVLQ